MISWLITPFGLLLSILTLALICARVHGLRNKYDNGAPFLASIVIAVCGLLVIMHNIITYQIVSDSTEPWHQIYGNELNAPVSLDVHGSTVNTSNTLTDNNIRNLHEIYFGDDITTITIGDSNNSSSRKIHISEIEGDLTTSSVITKIEYRKATTMHKRTAWISGESQPSDYQGDIRITLGKSNNKTDYLFGD
jgi:hypothetical protein